MFYRKLIIVASVIMLLVPVSVQETFGGGGLKVIVHGNGEACVSSSNENLGCRQISSQGTFEFNGSPDTFRACLNGSCQSGSNSPASAPENVYFGSGGGGFSGGSSSTSGSDRSRGNLIDDVCNFAQTNRALAAGAAVLLGYPGLDVAVRELCTFR
jgi:hypothetical protein